MGRENLLGLEHKRCCVSHSAVPAPLSLGESHGTMLLLAPMCVALPGNEHKELTRSEFDRVIRHQVWPVNSMVAYPLSYADTHKLFHASLFADNKPRKQGKREQQYFEVLES